MLDIQLLQQSGVRSLRKMALFIDECQQTQFLEQQEKTENKSEHRWMQMSHKLLDVVAC